MDRLVQENGHPPVSMDVPGMNRLPVEGECHEDVPEPPLQIPEVMGQAEDRHDLGGGRDDEMFRPGDPGGFLPHTHDNVPEPPIACIETSFPQDPVGIDLQWIVVVDGVVQHGGEEVVGRCHRRDIAGEVKVDVLHGDHLGVPAPRAHALHPEDGPKGGFPKGKDGGRPEPVQCLGQTDCRGGLPLPLRGRGHGGDEHELPIGFIPEAVEKGEGYLRLEAPEGMELLIEDPHVLCQLLDGTLGYGLGNLEIALHVTTLSFIFTMNLLFRMRSWIGCCICFRPSEGIAGDPLVDGHVGIAKVSGPLPENILVQPDDVPLPELI